ncbi:hypothetical protein [Streptomyces sp. NBC_00212]|uniref:hypothetical protein n=1 Tax=Streptomyces sp. NBC_00212 TaxID=2975684 RepID=UPI003253CD8E
MASSVSNTAPHYLHQVLSRVHASGAQSLREGWSGVLDAEWGSGEFARRHAEVAALLSETMQQVQALPERARLRYSRYFSDWWLAVVQPNSGWTDPGRSANGLITQDILDHLESAADQIDGALAGTSSAPRGSNLQDLKDSCTSWLEILRGAPAGDLPVTLQEGLISQILHLIWLIDNADLFGGSRISREANQVIGSLAQAAVVNRGDVETTGRWKRALLAFIASAALFTTGATELQNAIGAGDGLVKEIGSVVDGLSG